MGIFLDNLKFRLQSSVLLTLIVALFVFFLLTIGLVLVFMVVFGGLFQLSMNDITGILEGAINTEYTQNLFRVFQILNQLFTWGLCGWIMASFFGTPSDYLGFTKIPKPTFLLGLAALCIIASLPLVQAITFNDQNFSLPESMESWESYVHESESMAQEVIIHLLKAPEWYYLIFNILVFAVTPAIFEELFFRGFLQKQLMRSMNPYVAILLTASIFSLIHFQFYGIFSRLILGIMLGLFFYQTGSLWTSILAHFLFNMVSVVFVYIAYQTQTLSTEIVENDYPIPIVLTLLSLCGVIISLYFFITLSSESSFSVSQHE